MKHWFQKRRGKNLVGLLLLPFALYFMWRWFEHNQVYFPFSSFQETGAALGRPWEDVSFEAADGTKLNGWFFPSDTNSPRARWAVLLCHGNAGNISHRLEYYDLLLRLGVSVFAFDYRGYGRSRGSPSEEGTYQDAEAAYGWLRDRSFEPPAIIALGESLGGAVASELALRVPLGGVILVSTFTSIPAVGAELFPWLPVRRLCTIQYDTLSKLPRLKVPVLILHSRSDTIIGYHHAERNFASANEPKVFCEIQGDHNDTLEAGLEHCRKGIDQFLASLEKVRRDEAIPLF